MWNCVCVMCVCAALRHGSVDGDVALDPASVGRHHQQPLPPKRLPHRGPALPGRVDRESEMVRCLSMHS